MEANNLTYRKARLSDIPALLNIENACFDTDRLSERSFKRWVQADTGELLVGTRDDEIVCYGLILVHRGTRLARLYSLAVAPEMRGQGLASKMLVQLERLAIESGKLYMRLEVSKENSKAIGLYDKMNYRIFGEYTEYYDDHSDALRMQKILRPWQPREDILPTPWYGQTMDFTCGPAALLMAMASLDNRFTIDQLEEIDIWREATTVFMTSGHGGTHPIGLALAAVKRGFKASVYLNIQQPPFLDSVRANEKKEIMTKVHNRFVDQALELDIPIYHSQISLEEIRSALGNGKSVVCLISTYRLDRRKAPHWVVLTHIDDQCIYLHDPDVGAQQLSVDCQHVPITFEDFEKMSVFGVERLRTSLILDK